MDNFGEIIIRSVTSMVVAAFTALIVLQFMNKDFITTNIPFWQGVTIVFLIVLGMIVLVVVEVLMRRSMKD